MSLDDQRARYATATAGVRVFALIVLAPPVALSQSYDVIVSALLLAAIWTGGVFADGLRRVPAMPALVVEASLVTFIVCLALADSPLLLVSLLVTPFIGGLVRGTRGALEVFGAQAIICLATIVPNADIDNTRRLFEQLFVWLMLALAVGLVAAVVHRLRRDDIVTTSYRDARRLLVHLRELSDELVVGLDPVGISNRVLDVARTSLPLTGAVVYTPSPHGFTPLVEGDVSDEDLDIGDILSACLATRAPVIEGPWAAFPLMTDAGVVAIVAGGLVPDERRAPSELRRDLATSGRLLRPLALQLDTALLFASVRDGATSDERQRLARELHDGVAQDLASLGYLIDDLAETSTSTDQAVRCEELRCELRRVVTELRRSLFVLRNEADDETSLGEGVRALAAHLESRGGARIVVTTSEGARRLRPGVEAELLRITQEAMTNAVKHSGANLIEVDVRICAPEATISVHDDGIGLADDGRDDSHGIHIMQERARRIGAALVLRNREHGPGAELRVVLTPSSRHGGRDRTLEGTTP